MSSNPIGWFEIYVQDMDRARAFYEAVFKVSLERIGAAQPELWRFPQSMTAHGASGALAKMEGVPSGGNSTLVYFTCGDCAEELGRVAEAGGTVHREKISIGEYGFVGLAIDTEGNLIGMHSLQ